MISICPIFFLTVCYLLMKLRIGIRNVKELCVKKKKSFVSCLLLLTISQYVCILQSTEDIL